MGFFDVPGDAYSQFMGRYSEPLADQYVELVGVGPGQRPLDVGCGPGVLTARLAQRCGADAVAAVDPSTSFVAAARERLPGVDVREAAAEDLPFADDEFDAALAQLVVHFMADPVAGLREMGRVTRPGGSVSASVWDHHGGTGPLSPFWQAACDVDPAAPHEADLAGSREGHLADLAHEAGLADVTATDLTVRIGFASFEEWWAPYLLGVGTAGSYAASLPEEHRRAVEQRCRELLPEPPFEQEAKAWVVLARAGAS
jgi:SAM-dependent methyltransferase